MSATDGYWFVPLGRERGGLLDLLGVPPDVGEVAVADAKSKYILNVKNSWKAPVKEIKDRVSRGEVSKEFLAARQAELKADVDDKLMAFNQLEEKYSALVAERRKQQRDGIAVTAADPWLDPLGGPEVTVADLLARARALPQLTEARLAEAERAWALPGSSSGGKAGELARREGELAKGLERRDDPPERLAQQLEELLVERDLAWLVTADALWARVPHTNRACWAQRVEDWIWELGEAGAGLHAAAVPVRVTGAVPSLAEPTPLAAGEVRMDDAEDFRKGPERPVATQAPKGLLDVLAEMERQLAGAGPGASAHAPADVGDEIAGLRAALEAMMARAARASSPPRGGGP